MLSFGDEYIDETTDDTGNWRKSDLIGEVKIVPQRTHQFETFSPGEYLVDDSEDNITFYRDHEIFNNNNISGVSNNPHNPTEFTISDHYLITHIRTYHWNGGSGATPGTIALEDEDGHTIGQWQAGEWGSNRYWYVEPDIALSPGTYTIIDSDNSTWSHNSTSGFRGFAYVGGLFIE